MALSDQLTQLAARIKELEDRAAAAQAKAKDDLEQDVKRSRDSAQSSVPISPEPTVVARRSSGERARNGTYATAWSSVRAATRRASSTRELMSSLAKIWRRWESTVCGETITRAAASLFVSPSAMSSAR